ncbi:MAG: Mur ligase family protein, partial [Congregibacter sp.]|nr:Mur ligase family protein [Congregibacter sp.]
MTPDIIDVRRSLPLLLEGMATDVPALDIGALCLDSRLVQPGDVFVALHGQAQDGRAYLAQAAAAGAVVALVEDALLDESAPLPTTLPTIVIPALRQRLCEIAGRYYRDPSRQMHVAAVTGTNGKTTVSQLFAQIVRSAGYDCGVIGTLGSSLDGAVLNSIHTTPDSIALQQILAGWAGRAVPFVSMEASSHALDQGRLNNLDIDSAIFTNLSRDHLDYHGSMQAYGDAKARLFAFASLRAAILNADDPFAATLARHLQPGVSLLRYGINDASADVRISNLQLASDGFALRIESPWGNAALKCP